MALRRSASMEISFEQSVHFNRRRGAGADFLWAAADRRLVRRQCRGALEDLADFDLDDFGLPEALFDDFFLLLAEVFFLPDLLPLVFAAGWPSAGLTAGFSLAARAAGAEVAAVAGAAAGCMTIGLGGWRTGSAAMASVVAAKLAAVARSLAVFMVRLVVEKGPSYARAAAGIVATAAGKLCEFQPDVRLTKALRASSITPSASTNGRA